MHRRSPEDAVRPTGDIRQARLSARNPPFVQSLSGLQLPTPRLPRSSHSAYDECSRRSLDCRPQHGDT